MKTLHSYLTGQVLATLLMTVAVFTFVLLLGNVLKEVLGLLINRQASLGLVVRAVVLLIPYVLVFALPMGLLTATLLVFGRFSADNELTAVRASGISLVAVITPILLLSVALSGVCAWINLHLAPQCRVAYKRLIYNVDVGKLQNLVPERTFIRDFPGYTAFFGNVDENELRDIRIYRMDAVGTNVTMTLRAPRGTMQPDVANRRLGITLYNVSAIIASEAQGDRQPLHMDEWSVVLEFPARTEKPAGLSELTFSELIQKKREFGAKNIDTTPIEVQMHAQVAFSFACIGFTLVGIPLGIRAHRRETSAGIGMSILLVMVYYSFLILGQSLETKTEYAPHLIVWIPNFLFQAIGMVMLRRVDRGL